MRRAAVMLTVALSLGMGTAFQAAAQATATTPEQLGQVNFPVSCSGEAPAKFHRAMALYHSFDWKKGKAAFDEIVSSDPRCGMAYWGQAMIAADNPFGWPVSLKLQEGAEAIQQAQDVGAATPRERDYIAALAALYKDHATVPHRQRALADHEDQTEKHVVTPGPIMPARELLGDLLMELGRPADALPQYEASIAKEPNRFRGLYGAGLAAERAGDRARAKAHFEKLAAITAQSDATRPELAHARQAVSQR